MSRVSKRTPVPDGQGIRAGIVDLADVTRRALSGAVSSGGSLLDAYIGMLEAVIPSACRARGDRCAIPETECPPYCVCQIDWEASRGEHLHATIRVTNVGKQSRLFVFQADPFQGSSGDTGVAPSLSPTTATLDPNQSVVVSADLDVGEQFQPSGSYSAEIKIRGAYEQCVQIQLLVRPEHKVHCEVQQGEIPTRIRAHHWYDHFQCEELCFEPIRGQSPPENPTVPTRG
jgi:hypothetical protein